MHVIFFISAPFSPRLRRYICQLPYIYFANIYLRSHYALTNTNIHPRNRWFLVSAIKRQHHSACQCHTSVDTRRRSTPSAPSPPSRTGSLATCAINQAHRRRCRRWHECAESGKHFRVHAMLCLPSMRLHKPTKRVRKCRDETRQCTRRA